MSNNAYPVIKPNGEVLTHINLHLLKKQKAECNLDKIVDLYIIKNSIFEKMQELEPIPKNKIKLLMLAHESVEVEKKLQYFWNFAYNEKYFRFWEIPHCTCHSLDNLDNYPTGPYWYSQYCIIHG